LIATGIQTLFEEARADALLLIDTCCAANCGTSKKPRGVTELVASCGFNSSAYAGEFSFTQALIGYLEESQETDFSVPRLYSGLISRMRNSPNRLEYETPFHCTLTTDTNDRTIRLPRLPPLSGQGLHPRARQWDQSNRPSKSRPSASTR
jgi:hypothetical protein